MPIETACPGCKRQLRVADEHAGKQARCPMCSTVYTVSTTPIDDSKLPTESKDFPNLGAEPAVSQSPSWSMKTPEGQIYGPVTRAEMDQWVADGRVASDCQLTSGDGSWSAAEQHYPVLAPKPTESANPSYGSTANPFTDNPYQSASHATTGQSQPSSRPYVQPHRGPLILIFGIMSWMMCPIFGFVAWVMGSSDIREMRLGRMDDSGMGLTQAGYIFGNDPRSADHYRLRGCLVRINHRGSGRSSELDNAHRIDL